MEDSSSLYYTHWLKWISDRNVKDKIFFSPRFTAKVDIVDDPGILTLFDQPRLSQWEGYVKTQHEEAEVET